MDKRLIEDSFPVKEVSENSAKEKNIRRGHISTLHIWWARRPLSSSRSTNYASLIPAPNNEVERENKRKILVDLSKWENSNNENLLENAKKEILKSNNGKPPKVLDPFSGGGSIPLEALRLGCETYANDYNPIAVLIEKCTLEYPMRYCTNDGEWSDTENKFIKEIKKWGKWVLEESKKEIGEFYPTDPEGANPIGYIWARTIPCQNPSCNAEIPIMRQFWLAKGKNKKIALLPIIRDNDVTFKIVGQNEEIPKDFDPSKGTVKRAVSKCLVCDSVIEADTTRKLFKNGESDIKMIAVVLEHPTKGKIYRLANEKDIKIFEKSERFLEKKRNILKKDWGFDPIPTEPLKRVPVSFGVINVWVYGMEKWGDLFNSRQLLALITFAENTRKLFDKLIEEGYNKEYAKAITTYIALVTSRIADTNSEICHWDGSWQKICTTFARQAIPMNWDFVEVNEFSKKGYSFNNILNSNITKVLKNLSNIHSNPVKITNCSATKLPYNDNFFDAVFTDPPYYDNVPYSYLSDFFYVWLKRAIGHLYPELFLTPLSPKKEEIVAYKQKSSIYKDGKEFFESKLKESFREIHRILKPNGITTIVYAHKTTEGWETVINSLLDSGLTITASWPLSTELRSRIRAKNSAALASSIYIVARKVDKKDLGFFKEVKQEIETYIPLKLDKLWQEGISGADFFVAAIGSAIEVFGKYEKVIDNEGNEIRADKLLNFVRNVVTDYAMHQILHNGTAAELSPLSKFYLLWRWNYQELNVPFDEARKLAQSAGIDLANEWNKGFIVKRGDKISVQGPDKRDLKTLQEPIELIDVLHKVCLLWKTGNTNQMKETLRNSGYATNDAFYKVAQAISETLPNSSSEKKLIEGFLAGKDTIIKETKKIENPQTKLM